MSEVPIKRDAYLGDDLGDWRIRFIAKVQTNKGLRVIDAPGELQAPTGEVFSFADFMAVAMYLSVAITADAEAKVLRSQIRIEEFETPTGPYKTITHENLGTLYDFIEQSAVAAIFSFQALEAYANFVIEVQLRDGEDMFKCPGRSKALMGAQEILACGETMEKLKTIVPRLRNVKPPTKEPFWSKVWDMKRVRDALTHLKYKDQSETATAAVAAQSLIRTDPDFVFYNLVSGAIRELPRAAVEMLDYFSKGSGTPRWLLYPLSVYGIAPTPVKGTIRITLGPPI
jgi:hypothetical protein